MVIRTAVFTALYFAFTALTLIVCSPVVLTVLKPRQVMAVVAWWAGGVMALHRIVVGARHEVRGREQLPAGGVLVAAKHQSAWETIALIPLLPDPVFILKQELMRLPLFGWWASRAGMIPVDRRRGARALSDMAAKARQALSEGRQIVIFPEGTRRPLGAEPDYKVGVAHLYRDLKVPMVPVALNSGAVWPRHATHQAGTIVLEFLPPIPPGESPRAALARLQTAIEAASDRLLLEAAAEGLRLEPVAAERVRVLRDAATAP